MARKKTAAELAAEVKRLEERLEATREKEKRQSKAEEAKQNAAIIREIREWWTARPEKDRPKWEDMPGYLHGILTGMVGTKQAGGAGELSPVVQDE